MTNFLSQIRRQYASLTPAEKRLADCVLQAPAQAVTLSAAALAKQSGTAPSAVIRLCKSLGYSGFSDFKLNLAVALRQNNNYMPDVEKNDSPATVLDKIFSANIKALQDTVSRLDREAFSHVVDLICHSRKIYIYGVGTSAGPAMDLQHRLMLLGLQAQVFTDIAAMGLSTMNLQPGDLAFAISHSGRTGATVDALMRSRKAGAATACLTSYHASPVTLCADRVLTVFCDETNYPVEAVSARIAQSSVIDALVAAVSAANYDAAVQRSQQIHDIMETIRPPRRYT